MKWVLCPAAYPHTCSSSWAPTTRWARSRWSATCTPPWPAGERGRSCGCRWRRWTGPPRRFQTGSRRLWDSPPTQWYLTETISGQWAGYEILMLSGQTKNGWNTAQIIEYLQDRTTGGHTWVRREALPVFCQWFWSGPAFGWTATGRRAHRRSATWTDLRSPSNKGEQIQVSSGVRKYQ